MLALPFWCLRHSNHLAKYLDANRARPYSPPMINAATIAIARRRRTLAVWADVCV
jgi:hypothetical protein